MSVSEEQARRIETAPGAVPPPILRNMSMRPATPVEWSTGGVGRRLVLFEPPDDARINLRRALSAWGGKREAVRRLEEAWAGFGLIGAALLYRRGRLPLEDGDRTRPNRCWVAQDHDLVLNVLCRSRSGLLLPDFPLSLTYAYVRQSLWTDDARLVRLAFRTGATELKE